MTATPSSSKAVQRPGTCTGQPMHVAGFAAEVLAPFEKGALGVAGEGAGGDGGNAGLRNLPERRIWFL